MSGRAGRGSPEAGFTLVALMASVALTIILMGVGARSWQNVMKNEREEELIFRGGQIADAIQSYQAKHANMPPPSLEVLVKGKFLRKLYKDPMTRKGEWRLVRQGESLTPVPGPSPSGRPSPGPSPSPQASPPFPGRSPAPGGPGGQGLGAVVGVASRSTEKGLRVFNGRKQYHEWIFAPGQPRIVGRTSVIPVMPGAAAQQPGGRPGGAQPPRGAAGQGSTPIGQ